MKQKILFAALMIFLLSCQNEKEAVTGSDTVVKGEKVDQIEFDDSGYEDLGYYFVEEEELCDLIDIEVLTTWFPEAATPSKTPQGMSQYGPNNGACSSSWVSVEDIDRKQAGKYIHLGKRGRITLMFGKNPDPSQIDNYSQRSLAMRVGQKSEDYPELDFDYYHIPDIGTYAIWNEGSSNLVFALGENYVFTLTIAYPLEEMKRLQLAKDLALALIEKVQQ